PGTVVATTPGAGQSASADTRIVLQLSGGPAEPETVAIPDVSGDPEGSARTALRNAGFTGRFTTESIPAEPDDTVGTVFETDPPAGTEVPLDQLITIYVYVAGPDTGTETPGG
ncbi:MAG: PASTA domain-containing protein, partial [Blastococcus sp.]|nr:PASTA domain-containing protein [Blastococcus sp.]